MADTNDLKQLLKTGAISTGKLVSERQLNEAVELIKNRKQVSRDDIRELGEKVAHDGTTFANTDIDDINTVLDQLDD
jgi:hypothetical protein